MCGIAGIIGSAGTERERMEALRAMSAAMTQRGPDGDGFWSGEDGRVALAHRRLSIIAPGPDGAQPMTDPTGRYVISYNGEVYNYRELRAELEAEGYQFRSEGSDTETILAAYARWGEEGFRRLRGMYAFAIWDSVTRRLVLARDPYGIKPLYISRASGGLLFASQLRAIVSSGLIDTTLDHGGLVGFGIWGSVPEPFTILRAVEMVPAGSWLRFDIEGRETSGVIEDVATTFAEHEHDLPGDARAALRDSLAAHLVADVEVGCFLSAGVDSSAIAGMMHDLSPGRVRAITLGFAEFAGTPSDEAPLAGEVARRYGIDHVVERVTAEDFANSRRAIAADMDQPSVDGVNTWLVSRGAHRAGLKVALSGLGGDEILAGYSTFRTVRATRRAGALLSAIPGATGLAGFAMKAANLPGKAPLAPKYSGSLARTYLLRRAMLLPEQLEALLPPEIVAEGLARLQPVERLDDTLSRGPRGQTAQVALLESTQYMRNQLLRDSDWAGMAHSLEIRVPLVDIRLLAALAPAQDAFGKDPGAGKRILARTPRESLPASITDRPKTGFQVPVAQWISDSGAPIAKGSLGWAKEVLGGYCATHGLTL